MSLFYFHLLVLILSLFLLIFLALLFPNKLKLLTSIRKSFTFPTSTFEWLRCKFSQSEFDPFMERSNFSLINSYPNWSKLSLKKEYCCNNDILQKTYRKLGCLINKNDLLNLSIIKENLSNLNCGFVYLDSNILLNSSLMCKLAQDFLHSNYWDKLGNDPNFDFRKRWYSRLELNNAKNKSINLESKSFLIPDDENVLLGDAKRDFMECSDEFLNDPFFNILIWKLFNFLPLNNLNKLDLLNYQIGIHPIRIIDNGNGIGLPTPEGIHRDGCQFVAIILINRNNCDKNCALSKIYDTNAKRGLNKDMTSNEIKFNENKCLLFDKIMYNPFELILLNDRIVQHSVTAISPPNNSNIKCATRDVLVVTFMTKTFSQNTYSKYDE